MPDWLHSVLQMLAVLLVFGALSLVLIAWERSDMRKRQEPLRWHPPQGCKRCGSAEIQEDFLMTVEWGVLHEYSCRACGKRWNEREAR